MAALPVWSEGVMEPRLILAYCLKKPGAYPDYPFGPGVTVIKVGRTENRSGRIFAQIFTRNDKNFITLNCDMMTGQFYRSLFPGIVVRGYHCPPVQQPYFNTLPLLDGTVPDEILIEMTDHSYTTVVGKLPGYVRKRLRENE